MVADMVPEAAFKKRVWRFYRATKRTLPWRMPVLRPNKQGVLNPYRVVVSEIMLQQTQAGRVVVFYKKFIKKFPSFSSLAKASTNELLKAWQGLGYNRRALYLRGLARVVVSTYHGKLPNDPALLSELPGIGKGTAGSLQAFVFNKPVSFIETNIRRVFIHHFFKDVPAVQDKEILALVEKTLDKKNPREWYYALMDYGAHLGAITKNPNRRSAHYKKQSKFEGSRRQLRGRVLRYILDNPSVGEKEVVAVFKKDTRIKQVYTKLKQEGFI